MSQGCAEADHAVIIAKARVRKYFKRVIGLDSGYIFFSSVLRANQDPGGHFGHSGIPISIWFLEKPLKVLKKV